MRSAVAPLRLRGRVVAISLAGVIALTSCGSSKPPTAADALALGDEVVMDVLDRFAPGAEYTVVTLIAESGCERIRGPWDARASQVRIYQLGSETWEPPADVRIDDVYAVGRYWESLGFSTNRGPEDIGTPFVEIREHGMRFAIAGPLMAESLAASHLSVTIPCY